MPTVMLDRLDEYDHPFEVNDIGLWCPMCGELIAAPFDVVDTYVPPEVCRGLRVSGRNKLQRNLKSDSQMTPDEFKLLLTVARILRASRSESCDHHSGEDVGALDEALEPWAPRRSEPVNEDAE